MARFVQNTLLISLLPLSLSLVVSPKRNASGRSHQSANRGLIYSRNAPYDTDGGQYYLRLDTRF